MISGQKINSHLTEIIRAILRRDTSWEKHQLLILKIQQVNKYKFGTFHSAKEVSLEKNTTWLPGNGYHYKSNYITKNSWGTIQMLLIDVSSFIFNPLLFKDSSFWIRTSQFIILRAQEIYQLWNYNRKKKRNYNREGTKCDWFTITFPTLCSVPSTQSVLNKNLLREWLFY